MTLSAIRRLISRAVVRVAMLKSVVFILRMARRHIVRRANNMPLRILCQEFLEGGKRRASRLSAGRGNPARGDLLTSTPSTGKMPHGGNEHAEQTNRPYLRRTSLASTANVFAAGCTSAGERAT